MNISFQLKDKNFDEDLIISDIREGKNPESCRKSLNRFKLILLLNEKTKTTEQFEYFTKKFVPFLYILDI